jgi:pyochelin biosynthetic protein PchC
VSFPHAGGSAGFFRTWGASLPDVEVLAVRYPGRAERIDEPGPEDLVALAHDIADAIEALETRPIALFGHSMGAPIALETARRLELRDVAVAHVFASGSRAGDVEPPAPVVDDTDETTIARLLELGGTDPELASDPWFQELVLPYVQSDGRMFHAYEMDDHPPLRCPVTAIVGDRDVDADVRPWPRLTLGPYEERSVSGDHFYLVAAPPFDVIREALASVLFDEVET